MTSRRAMEFPSSPRGAAVTPREPSLASLEWWGALAAGAGLMVWLAQPPRRCPTPARGREALIAYLRDHLAGSDVATRVVHRLASTQQGGDDRMLFQRLAREFDEDRSAVRALLGRLGTSGRSIKRVVGFASGTVLSLAAGGEPGDLSLLRTLEALSIGVQGKRCMWRALQNVPRVPSGGHGMNFIELEAKAVRQWDAIEERRCRLVARTFVVPDPQRRGDREGKRVPAEFTAEGGGLVDTHPGAGR